MPFLKEEGNQPTAGTNTVTIEKPTGEKVVILGISVRSVQENLFAGAACELSQIVHQYRAIALFGGTVTSSTGTSTKMFTGHQEWPHNYELKLYFITQNASDKLFYVIEYEIVTKKVEKRRWW